MTKNVVVPLQSARLVEYAVPISCYVCDGQNNFDAEFCRDCSAPLALAHQANTQKVAPGMIACLGASGAGKTVYLGMLMDMLSRGTQNMQSLARGAFSITLQQVTMAALARCEFPEKTPNEPDRWNWVHCQIRQAKRRQPTELIVPDMAGEAFSEEINHPNSFRVIGAFLKKAVGALVLIDANKILEGGQDQEYFTMKLISYLAELLPNSRNDWQRKPIALVFTKADQIPKCLEDPTAFAKDHATGVWQHCRERFRRHQFFASGVAGACGWRLSSEGRVRVPLRVEPHGIIEPFRWLMESLK